MTTDKKTIFSEMREELEAKGLHIHSFDPERPWGGFFVIEESDAKMFIDLYFPTLINDVSLAGKLSPKILLVAPAKKLSWQYHFRRSEVWTLIKGNAAVITSNTDVESETTQLIKGKIITLKQGERHRLVGLDQWGFVAEIWIHTDINHPSDEDDIVRLKDDFGR